MFNGLILAATLAAFPGVVTQQPAQQPAPKPAHAAQASRDTTKAKPATRRTRRHAAAKPAARDTTKRDSTPAKP